jgi:hypothetical protein
MSFPSVVLPSVCRRIGAHRDCPVAGRTGGILQPPGRALPVLRGEGTARTQTKNVSVALAPVVRRMGSAKNARENQATANLYKAPRHEGRAVQRVTHSVGPILASRPGVSNIRPKICESLFRAAANVPGNRV